jgi:hypothetical protein
MYNGIINERKTMLEIAFGMKQVQEKATMNPMVAMMAAELEDTRNNLSEDEFLTFLANFAITVSAMAISETVQLCLDQPAQDELEKTILEMMEIDELGKE